MRLMSNKLSHVALLAQPMYMQMAHNTTQCDIALCPQTSGRTACHCSRSVWISSYHGVNGHTFLLQCYMLTKWQTSRHCSALVYTDSISLINVALCVQVTNDASDVTAAHFMGEVGRRVPVAARFSTVTHEKGSPESLRDVRGFSVKMYTEQGNWDFVGNNIPVSTS